MTLILIKSVTQQFPKESDWKKLMKTGRHSAKDGWKTEEKSSNEYSGFGCSICVLGLSRPIIVFYGFADSRCTEFIRSKATVPK